MTNLSGKSRKKYASALVYFILLDEMIKIGRAVDIEKRMGSLKVGNPQANMVLLGTIPGGKDEERALHHYLAEDRVTGEWFRNSQRVLDTVNNVLSVGIVEAGIIIKVSERRTNMHPIEKDAYKLIDLLSEMQGLLGVGDVREFAVTLGGKSNDIWDLKYHHNKGELMMEHVARLHSMSARAIKKVEQKVSEIQKDLCEAQERWVTLTAAALDGSHAAPLNDGGEA